MDLSDLNSYLQLIQDIIAGTVRRHTFTPAELNLLLDVQSLRVRKTSRNEALRQYSRAIQQHFTGGLSAPVRFSRFWQDEYLKEGGDERRSLHLVRTGTAPA